MGNDVLRTGPPRGQTCVAVWLTNDPAVLLDTPAASTAELDITHDGGVAVNGPRSRWETFQGRAAPA